ncbi:unnamed protein product [Calypogeia fissa]
MGFAHENGKVSPSMDQTTSAPEDSVPIFTKGSNAVKVANGLMKRITPRTVENGDGPIDHQKQQQRVKFNDDIRVSPSWTDDQSSLDLSTDYENFSEIDSSEISSEADMRVHSVDERNPTAVNVIRNFKVDAVEYSDDESDEDDEREQTTWEFPESKLPEEDLNFEVDARDMGTSDSWVRRHPDMIRLTGRHPFNSEAPLPTLMAQGFLTPTNLHYVRNHGYVPQGVWDDWRIEITGRVKRPCKLSMNDLVTKFPHRELPVTLVCAGNRRMEQNLVSQTIGFNWGAAGLSTSVWKGVRLCDVLRYCGVVSKKKGAEFVCFEGAETLPAAGGTRYGTSITIDVALDEGRDVLIAFEQNGKPLDPDHGYPVRMILPGHIGGRMVKWLTKIDVTPSESFNYYHFNDNRVLPSHVNAEMAKAEGWWYKPDYIINELNINSAITTPAHDEVLPFESARKPYTVKGYAYTGGGRKIIRVEVSLDAGTTWRLCDVKYDEKPTESGKYWCWVLWQLDVDVTDFLQSKELVVRAWDAGMNTQPERLTWNVMGMMNNCWFRVKVAVCKTESGSIGLNFQHPTQPGKKPGGWMYTEKAAKAPVAEKTPSMHKSVSSPGLLAVGEKQIPMSEVRRHTDSQSAWIVVHGVVYDCTPFLKDHPGGADSILLTAGTDCTEEFDGIHSEKAKGMLEKYKVGVLAAETEEPGSMAGSTAPTPESSLRGGNNFTNLVAIPEEIPEAKPGDHPVALNPRERKNFQLIEKETLSEDVRKLRFTLQSKDHILGLPVGKHVLVAGRIGEKLVMRAYTPISSDKDAGYFDLLVKVYFKSQSYPMGGLMSQYLDSLQIGDTVAVKGPIGHVHYEGRGKITIDKVPKVVKNFSMIAGGTGVTPMYQIIRAIVEDLEDTTEVSLIYCNRTEADIMLKEQLDAWQEKHSNFKVWYTLSTKPRDGWAYSTGRISEQMMREHLPAGGSSDNFACLCGPPALEAMCYGVLDKMGYGKQNCFSF